jgi:hypothetical protein
MLGATMSNGVRARALAFLTPRMRGRIALELGAAGAIAMLANTPRMTQPWLWPISCLLAGAVVGAAVWLYAISLLPGTARVLAWSLRVSRTAFLATAAGGLAAALGTIWFLGSLARRDPMPALGRWAAAALPPAAFILVIGVWAGVLTHRRVRASRHRWLRHTVDVIAVAAGAACARALFDRDLLATMPAAGLLFPPGVWASFRTWRAMTASKRLAVRAGADVALSLMLGTCLVLLVVWAANLLGLPEHEVAALRAGLDRVGVLADLPWWLWASLYALLTGLTLAPLLRPGYFAVITRWTRRMVPPASITHRALTCVHIGLLTVVLIGLAAPPAVMPVLRSQITAQYRLALQRELAADGELAAYQEIRRQFTASTLPPVTPLADVIAEIGTIGNQAADPADAASTEQDLAHRIGQLEATTLVRARLPQSSEDATPARLDSPIQGEADLRGRLGELSEQEGRSDSASHKAHEAGDLATAAVASTIQLPGMDGNQLLQIVKEYLSGLVEGGPLAQTFTAWAERLAGSTRPPDAPTMVVPDPVRLAETAAKAELTALIEIPHTFTGQAGIAPKPGGSAAAAAVDLANQIRYLYEGTGPCTGCAARIPGEEPGHGGEPVPEPPPEVHIAP